MKSLFRDLFLPSNAVTLNTKGSLVSLTALRGLAAFFVLISHTLRATEKQYMQGDEEIHFNFVGLSFQVLDLGSFGVSLFFVLSGFTLYYNYGNARLWGKLSTFYLRRIGRVWPAFFVAIMVYIAFRPVFEVYYGIPHGDWIERQFLQEYSLSDILLHLSFINNFDDPKSNFNNAFWSIPVEFQFYILFPIAVLLILRASPAVLAAVAGLLLVFGVKEAQTLKTVTMFWEFAGGVVLAWLYQRGVPSISCRMASVSLIILILTMSALEGNVFPNFEIDSRITFLARGVIAILSVFIVTSAATTKILQSRALVYYGEISYSVYLYHNLLIAVAVLICIQYGINNVSMIYFVFFVGFVGSFMVAQLSYRYIEKPGINVSKNIFRSSYVEIEKKQ